MVELGVCKGTTSPNPGSLGRGEHRAGVGSQCAALLSPALEREWGSEVPHSPASPRYPPSRAHPLTLAALVSPQS